MSASSPPPPATVIAALVSLKALLEEGVATPADAALVIGRLIDTLTTQSHHTPVVSSEVVCMFNVRVRKDRREAHILVPVHYVSMEEYEADVDHQYVYEPVREWERRHPPWRSDYEFTFSRVATSEADARPCVISNEPTEIYGVSIAREIDTLPDGTSAL